MKEREINQFNPRMKNTTKYTAGMIRRIEEKEGAKALDELREKTKLYIDSIEEKSMVGDA